MRQIKDISLFVGVKEQYTTARNKGMKIVCALNRSNGFVTHQSVVGWQGKGCDPRHPIQLVFSKVNITRTTSLKTETYYT